MAERSNLGIVFDNILGGISSIFGRLVPYGGYAGATGRTVSEASPVITNPWGVAAHFNTIPRDQRVRHPELYPDIYLKPGQSYNFNTGQYNDPTIHNKTAYRLNTKVNEMKANEAGLSQVFQDSARNGKSVLATVDELYWGDVRTSAHSGIALSGIQQAAASGYNTSNTKTILGNKPKATPVATVTKVRR